MTAHPVTTPQQPRNVVSVKALERASKKLRVIPRDPERGRYLVESGHQSGQQYEVALQQHTLSGHCTCLWARYGGINCKHVLAALRQAYAAEGELSFWPTPSAARRQHRPMLAGERLYATVRSRRRRSGSKATLGLIAS